MPDSCCALGCSNRRSTKSHLSFYRIPKAFGRRQLWLAAINRPNWSARKISNARLCSQHFITGRRSKDPKHPDYVPSVFSFGYQSKVSNLHKVTRNLRRIKRVLNPDCIHGAVNSSAATNTDSTAEENVQIECMEEPHRKDIAIQAQITDQASRIKLQQAYTEIYHKNELLYDLRRQIFELKRKCVFGWNNVQHDIKLFRFMTGLPTIEAFNWLMSLIVDNVQTIKKNLSHEDHLLIVLIKLKLGLTNIDIAYRFAITPIFISYIYNRWLPIIAARIGQLIIWPSKQAITENMPACFSRNFSHCIAIIDCTDIAIERPSNLTAKAQTWSAYRHSNTIKYLIGITPAGAVSFLSSGWGGKVSDNEITLRSGFIDKLSQGDVILADRGFLIQKELASRGAILKIPAIMKGKKQLSAREVDTSRELCHVRIYVEHVIGRLKKFKILQSTIPITQVQLLDDVMITIAGIVNLNRSVITKYARPSHLSQ